LSSPPNPRVRQLTIAFGVLVACANIGSFTAPSLLKHSPELVLALSSRIRHLLFSVPAGINPIVYAAIGYARLMLAAAICYELGRLVGHRVFAWFDAQLDGDRPATLRWIERSVERVDWLLVLLFPGSNIVCFLVGRRGMDQRRFFALASIGIGARLTWVWFAAKQFESELKTALDFVDRYQFWFVGLFLVLTIVPSMRKSIAAEKAMRAAAEAEADAAQAAAGAALEPDSPPRD
jgi:membrane protein DedA with SNARE-associated domain